MQNTCDSVETSIRHLLATSQRIRQTQDGQLGLQVLGTVTTTHVQDGL